jgi:hypothetical protein
MPNTEITHCFEKLGKWLGILMGWKGFGRKQSWPFCRHYSGICLEGLRETMRNTSQDSWYPDWYSNQIPLNTSEVLCYWCVFLFQQLALCKWLHKGSSSFTTNKKQREHTVHLHLKIYGNKYVESYYVLENKRQTGRIELSFWYFNPSQAIFFCL